MKQVTLPCGDTVSALGQGTWKMGDDPAKRAEEIATLRLGLELGMTLIDTAEMYGDGRSESLVGEAIAGKRDEAFIVSKVYPHNASRRAMAKSCEASLKRLGVEAIDLYLLHWPGSVPLDETVQAFEALQSAGKIRRWGVSNFDLELMQSLWSLPGGAAAQANQVLYNLGRRGIEWDLLPWMRAQRLPVMAYSPIEEGSLLRHRALAGFAERHGITPAQAALAWLIGQDGVIAIPKTGSRERLKDNASALMHPLSAEQRRELDGLFAPPKGPSALAMI